MRHAEKGNDFLADRFSLNVLLHVAMYPFFSSYTCAFTTAILLAVDYKR
jgi:hypothetical protein